MTIVQECLQGRDQDVTAAFILRSSAIAFCLVAGASISTGAETVKMSDHASADSSFIIAQTNGQDRRDTRQDCRQAEGAVGKDKRDCKQGS
jgi:hypothetical protein